jgi:hypothetical protein
VQWSSYLKFQRLQRNGTTGIRHHSIVKCISIAKKIKYIIAKSDRALGKDGRV